MARLTHPRRKDLSREDFERFSLWTWDDANEFLLPISDSEASPEKYGPLFIKAKFFADDLSLDGYLIGGSTFHAFGLFVHGREFVMNFNLPEGLTANVLEITKLLQMPDLQLFPLRYKSSIRFKTGRPITGVLSPRSNG